MRFLFGFLCALALGLMLSVGCGEGGKAFPCTEQGIRDAIAYGGGSHTFECDGPTTVVTGGQIQIDNDVILDGKGNLTVDGNERHRVFRVAKGITAELRRFTVTKGFSAQESGGGIYIYNGRSLTLTNTLVVNNDCAGNYFFSGGGNIESPGGRCRLYEPTDLSNITAEQLNLGPLQDNGGPTETHALLTDPVVSVAINRVPAEDCELETDQRGVARPQGPECDVGAFELEVAP